jgi:hypothetical protein
MNELMNQNNYLISILPCVPTAARVSLTMLPVALVPVSCCSSRRRRRRSSSSSGAATTTTTTTNNNNNNK